MTVILIVWSLAATVLAGSFIVVALLAPQFGLMLHLTDPQYLSVAALLGALVAVPIALSVGKALLGGKKP